MRKALERLRFECDYEDSRVGIDENYILSNKLAPGIGDKTISELKKMGLKSRATQCGDYVCKVGDYDIRHKIIQPKTV